MGTADTLAAGLRERGATWTIHHGRAVRELSERAMRGLVSIVRKTLRGSTN